MATSNARVRAAFGDFGALMNRAYQFLNLYHLRGICVSTMHTRQSIPHSFKAKPDRQHRTTVLDSATHMGTTQLRIVFGLKAWLRIKTSQLGTTPGRYYRVNNFRDEKENGSQAAFLSTEANRRIGECVACYVCGGAWSVWATTSRRRRRISRPITAPFLVEGPPFSSLFILASPSVLVRVFVLLAFLFLLLLARVAD